MSSSIDIAQGSPVSALMKLIAGQNRTLMMAISLAGLAVVAELIPYYLLYLAADVAMAEAPADEVLVSLAGWIALALVVKYLLLSCGGYLSHLAAFRILYEVRLRIADALTRLPLARLTPYSSGSLRKIIMNDVERLEGFIAHHTIDLMSALISPIIAACFLFWLDWKMALAVMVNIPLAIGAQKIFSHGMQQRTQAYNQATEQLNSAVVEFVRGIPVMKAFRQTARSFTLLHDRLQEYHALVQQFTRRTAPSWSLFVVLLNANIFILLPVGLWRMTEGTLTLPAFILVLMLGSGLLKPLLRVTFLGSQIREMLVGMARIQPLLSEQQAEHQYVAPDNNRIVAKNVYFRYDGRDVINNISFRLEPGSFTALVGPSGAGKSTLAWLLSGMLSPSSGSVTLGGATLAEFDDVTRSASLSVVTQEVFLFQGTLAENLRLGKPDASDTDIHQALGIAQASEFIAALPDGLNTKIGERGLRFSGGERQRLAIARALLVNAPILILDEATAFADALTEAAFYKALRQHYPQMTILTIAHRLYAVKDADSILVMEAGRLLASGRHQALLNNEPLYARLWRSQYSQYTWRIRTQEVSSVGY